MLKVKKVIYDFEGVKCAVVRFESFLKITEAVFFLFLPHVGQSPHLFFLRKKHPLKRMLVDSNIIRVLIFIQHLKLR